MEREARIPSPSLEIFQDPQYRSPSRHSPLSLFRERRSTSRAPFIHLTKSLVGESPSRLPSGSPKERDAVLQSLPFITFKVPSKGAVPPGSRNRAHTQRDALFPEPSLSYFSYFRNWAPAERESRLQNLLLHISPWHMSPLPESPMRPPWKEMPISRAFFYTSRFP